MTLTTTKDSTERHYFQGFQLRYQLFESITIISRSITISGICPEYFQLFRLFLIISIIYVSEICQLLSWTTGSCLYPCRRYAPESHDI